MMAIMAVYIAVRVSLHILIPKQLTGNTCFIELGMNTAKMNGQLLQPLRIMNYTIITIGIVS